MTTKTAAAFGVKTYDVLRSEYATSASEGRGRTPTVDLSRVPEEVWCVGFGCWEYALRAARRLLTESVEASVDVRGGAWREERGRREEEGIALERAAESVRADMQLLTLAPLLSTTPRSRPRICESSICMQQPAHCSLSFHGRRK